MKRKLRLIWVLVILLTLSTLAGCDNYDDLLTPIRKNVQDVNDGMISGVRTGILRQGITNHYKTSECSEDANWFFADIGGLPMLYRLEHDEQVLEPLCTRPGCEHVDSNCTAFYPSGGNVCLYEGSLYVSSGEKLYQVDPDSGERMVILDIGNDFEGQFDTVAGSKLLNGVFTFTLCRIAQPEDFGDDFMEQSMWTGLFNAKLIDYKDYYFKLDGSMDTAASISGNTTTLFNDGYSVLGYSSSALSRWDPVTNKGELISDNIAPILDIYEPLFDVPAPQGQDSTQYHAMDIHTLNEGYAGTEYALYLERTKNGYDITDNILCRLNYITGKSDKLLSTGLQGAYRLVCFPDCFVLVETIHENMTVPENPMMYIYSWEMEALGTCELNFPHAVAPQNLICGETANRIYLCAYYDGAPEYYIDKADLGNDTITYRELSYSNIDPQATYQDMLDKIDAYQAELDAMLQDNG